MTKEDIIVLPHSSLRQRSKKIGLVDSNMTQLIADMTAAMLDWEASRQHEITVGLAAVQVNKLLRLFILRDPKDKNSFLPFINPEITKYDGPIVEDYEGCLSISEIYGKVPRHQIVRIKALNQEGQPFSLKASGELARILQHETDHTNGKLFIDHIKDVPDAFFRLNDQGKLDQLDYETLIKSSDILW